MASFEQLISVCMAMKNASSNWKCQRSFICLHSVLCLKDNVERWLLSNISAALISVSACLFVKVYHLNTNLSLSYLTCEIWQDYTQDDVVQVQKELSGERGKKVCTIGKVHIGNNMDSVILIMVRKNMQT